MFRSVLPNILTLHLYDHTRSEFFLTFFTNPQKQLRDYVPFGHKKLDQYNPCYRDFKVTLHPAHAGDYSLELELHFRSNLFIGIYNTALENSTPIPNNEEQLLHLDTGLPLLPEGIPPHVYHAAEVLCHFIDMVPEAPTNYKELHTLITATKLELPYPDPRTWKSIFNMDEITEWLEATAGK